MYDLDQGMRHSYCKDFYSVTSLPKLFKYFWSRAVKSAVFLNGLLSSPYLQQFFSLLWGNNIFFFNSLFFICLFSLLGLINMSTLCWSWVELEKILCEISNYLETCSNLTCDCAGVFFILKREKN